MKVKRLWETLPYTLFFFIPWHSLLSRLKFNQKMDVEPVSWRVTRNTLWWFMGVKTCKSMTKTNKETSYNSGILFQSWANQCFLHYRSGLCLSNIQIHIRLEKLKDNFFFQMINFSKYNTSTEQGRSAEGCRMLQCRNNCFKHFDGYKMYKYLHILHWQHEYEMISGPAALVYWCHMRRSSGDGWW